MTTTRAGLDGLLRQDPARLTSAVQKRVRAALESHHHSLILFGTGELGRIAINKLIRMGKPPVACADNNPALSGTALQGVPVLQPEEARRKFPGSLFVVTVYTNAPVMKKLREAGISHITFADLAWCYPEAFLPRVALELPHKIFEQAEEVRAAFDLWADERSRQEYLGQLHWRCTLDPSVLPRHSPSEETYFPPDLFALSGEEVFIDCGTFDGDKFTRANLMTSSNDSQR